MMRVQLDDARLLVEVIDEGCGFERDLRRKDVWQVAGRGLGNDVAAGWGVHEGNTHVWFELTASRVGEADHA